MIIQVAPIIDYSVRGLCVKPYPGHVKGCPNFNKKKGCPPGAAKYDEAYDLNQPVYAIINKFDFKAHTERMRQQHPEWSERQVRCCLYWQPGARKRLLAEIKSFWADLNHRKYSIETCPEAMGVNITETLKNVSVILEWPPETVTYQVALAGIKKS
jgi:predicted metal-binding protein